MLITNAKIFTMEDTVIENGFIKIEDGKIFEVGDMSTCAFSDEHIINLKGCSIYPGFIDAHTHMGLFENGLTFEGDDGNEETDPLTPHLKTLDAINPMDKSFSEAINAGVTTVVVTPGSANPISGEILAMKTAGVCVDEMIIKSPIGIKFALGENPKSVYNSKDQSPMTRMATAALIREQLYKAKNYMETKKQAEQENDNDSFPEYNAKCEALIPLLERKIQAHFHVHRADDIFTAIRIVKEFNLDLVLVHATEGYIIKDYLSSNKTPILCGPIISDRSKPELSNFSVESAGVISNSNVLTSIITDHPETPIQYLVLSAMLAIKNGMSEIEALKAITINPAKICKIDDRVGSIRKGKDADFVVYSSSPFDFYANPLMVICNGQVVFKNQNF